MHRTPEELDEFMLEQSNFLKASATAFDAGFTGEAKRLAVTIRVLAHDTKNSTSLLNLTNKKSLQFVDTSIPLDEANLLSHSSLTFVAGSFNQAVLSPLLDDGPFIRLVGFEAWWNGIVFNDKDGNEFSRKDIVTTLANKEGGAHVDPTLNADYHSLAKLNSLDMHERTSDGRVVPMADPVPPAMRQIAHEMLKTLDPLYQKTHDATKFTGLFMGGSLVVGSHAPPIPTHNLVKNRAVVSGIKVGRNDTCPCGSGTKYKHCCLPK